MDASTIEANANRAKGDKGSKGLPEDVLHRRAVKEYIETLDDAAFGGATPTAPKFLSPVDPASKRKDGSFSRDDFIYDAKLNHYTCPGGKRLKRFRTKSCCVVWLKAL